MPLTTAEHNHGSVDLAVFCGHANEPFWVSFTITLTEQVEELPEASTAL